MTNKKTTKRLSRSMAKYIRDKEVRRLVGRQSKIKRTREEIHKGKNGAYEKSKETYVEEPVKPPVEPHEFIKDALLTIGSVLLGVGIAPIVGISPANPIIIIIFLILGFILILISFLMHFKKP